MFLLTMLLIGIGILFGIQIPAEYAPWAEQGCFLQVLKTLYKTTLAVISVTIGTIANSTIRFVLVLSAALCSGYIALQRVFFLPYFDLMVQRMSIMAEIAIAGVHICATVLFYFHRADVLLLFWVSFSFFGYHASIFLLRAINNSMLDTHLELESSSCLRIFYFMAEDHSEEQSNLLISILFRHRLQCQDPLCTCSKLSSRLISTRTVRRVAAFDDMQDD